MARFTSHHGPKKPEAKSDGKGGEKKPEIKKPEMKKPEARLRLQEAIPSKPGELLHSALKYRTSDLGSHW